MPTPLLNSSRSHLSSAGETYVQHLRFAAAVGSMLVAAGLACLVHAVVPGLCRDTASRTIACLQGAIADRSLLADAQRQTIEAVAFSFLVGMAVVLGAVFSTAGAEALPSLAVTLLALALPVTLLVTNPDLKPEEEEAAERG
jgi:hypothetical protein